MGGRPGWGGLLAEHEEVEIAGEVITGDDGAAPVEDEVSKELRLGVGRTAVAVDIEDTVNEELELVLGIEDGIGEDVIANDRASRDRARDLARRGHVTDADDLDRGLAARGTHR